MRRTLLNLIRKVFPELHGGYHLPRMGEIIAISDAPKEEVATNRYRPYYAVDVQLLTPEGLFDTSMPLMRALPLPNMAGGNARGFFGFPEIGSKVILSFCYGSPGHPYIQAILPNGKSMPGLHPSDQIWQQQPNHYQRSNQEGDWERYGLRNIVDDARNITHRAENLTEELYHKMSSLKGDHQESIQGSKETTCLGSVSFSAVEGLNLNSLRSLNAMGAGKVKLVSGKAMELRNDSVKLELDDAGLVYLGNDNANLKSLMTDLITQISTLIDHINALTVPTGVGPSGTPINTADFTTVKSDLTSLQSTFEQLLK